MTPMTFSRSRGQRSRSNSDGLGNLVNAIARKPMKGFEPKFTLILPIREESRTMVMKVMGARVKVTDGGGIQIDGSP